LTVGFLLDTSAINRICRRQANADRWRPAFITDVVLRELCATQDRGLRRQLLGVLDGRLGPGGILRSEGPIGHYGAGAALGHHQPLRLGRIFPLITRAIGSSFRRHWRDGFIAQVAIQYGLTLVTADRKLARAAREFGATVEFISRSAPP
jgi:predicted nucleic acid-binding protein